MEVTANLLIISKQQVQNCTQTYCNCTEVSLLNHTHMWGQKGEWRSVGNAGRPLL